MGHKKVGKTSIGDTLEVFGEDSERVGTESAKSRDTCFRMGRIARGPQTPWTSKAHGYVYKPLLFWFPSAPFYLLRAMSPFLILTTKTAAHHEVCHSCCESPRVTWSRRPASVHPGTCQSQAIIQTWTSVKLRFPPPPQGGPLLADPLLWERAGVFTFSFSPTLIFSSEGAVWTLPGAQQGMRQKGGQECSYLINPVLGWLCVLRTSRRGALALSWGVWKTLATAPHRSWETWASVLRWQGPSFSCPSQGLLCPGTHPLPSYCWISLLH